MGTEVGERPVPMRVKRTAECALQVSATQSGSPINRGLPVWLCCFNPVVTAGPPPSGTNSSQPRHLRVASGIFAPNARTRKRRPSCEANRVPYSTRISAITAASVCMSWSPRSPAPLGRKVRVRTWFQNCSACRGLDIVQSDRELVGASRRSHESEPDEDVMAEVLTEFSEPILGEDGIVYRAQAVGGQLPEGRWEGWIEFVPLSGGTPLRTPRETTQPRRGDAVYWASGLTPVYLEGALHRALRPLVQHVPPPSQPMFEEPAPAVVRTEEPVVPVTDAVLDPFEVYASGELILRRKLGALAADHLVRIIIAHRLSHEPVSSLSALSPQTLIDLIVGAVQGHRR